MTAIDELEDYPLVGGDPYARVPSRSVLASLKPMGMGTPYRESLSSYYLALAHLHHLSPKTLARELIIPRMVGEGERRSDGAFTVWNMPLFNGIGAPPERWAKVLSELTGQANLVDLTLVPLRPYTNKQRLTSQAKKWCPLCFEEAAKEGRVYGQLLWAIAAVDACPKHRIKLINRCECSGLSPLLTRQIKHLSGYCDSCGRFLTRNYEALIKSASQDEVDRAQLVADLLGDMKMLKADAHGVAGCGIPAFLRDAVRHFAGGKAAIFGRLLGIKKTTLHGWMNGGFLPTFPQTVEIAYSCGCSIADVMLGAHVDFEGTEIVNAHTSSRRSFRERETRRFDRKAVKRQLETLVSVNPPVSVAVAAMKIGVSRRTLFRTFGALARKMNERFQAHRHSLKNRKFEDKCALYKESAVRLIHQGIRPTQKLVALDIGGRDTVSQKPDERAACKRICEEVITNLTGSGCRLRLN